MTNQIVTKPDHGALIAEKDTGQATEAFQNFFDDLEQKLNASLFGSSVELHSYTVATLPEVPSEPGLIFVSDETGGAVPAFSDGTNWRRVTDRTIVS